MQVLLLVLFVVTIVGSQPKPAKPVTNEDIRNAILSVVHMMRSTEDKLERHEFRERALGEQLKKQLATLDKRIKLLDPIKGTIGRLDERLAGVETILITNDEHDKTQAAKMKEIEQALHANLTSMMRKLKDDIIKEIKAGMPELQSKDDMVSKSDVTGIEKNLSTKVDKLTSSIQKMQIDLAEIKDEHDNSLKINKQANEHMKQVKARLDNNEELLEKYKIKLAEYKTEPIPIIEKSDDDWQAPMTEALEVQTKKIETVLTEIQTITDKMKSLPKKQDLENAQNKTLTSLTQFETSITDTIANLNEKLEENTKKVLLKHEDVKQNHSEAVDNVAGMIETLSNNLATSYQMLADEIHDFSKLEQIMVQTSDGVMDTKRRVEYGVHQILLEIGDLVKVQSKEVNGTINERFNDFESIILDEETGAFANLTSKIGDEIDQVWRQIGIMHQQMRDSTDTLNKLQNHTDLYVNGSLDVMDSMKGKVGKITDRMTEVDENLNYLMGKLLLVTQEFNMIKSGLGKALDEIRETFHEVQTKVKNEGPGPFEIEVSNEVTNNHNLTG